MPAVGVFKSLDQTERDRLTRLLSKPFEFISDPCFTRPGIARELFASELPAGVSTRPWCNAADITPAFDGLGSSATLTGEQERRLFLQLNYARYRILRQLDRYRAKPLGEAAIREILWWQARVEDIQCRIIQANMPLVLAMAKRTKLGNIDYAELISEGNLALLRSVDKFDASRGFKFSTYACRAILKSFSRVAMKLSRYRGRFPVEFDPSLERSDHLDQTREDQEQDCLSELRGIIQANTASLNEVEVKVLQARFALAKVEGLDSDGPQTLEQVGMLIGVTKERVRQIQNRALAKLRDKLNEDFLAA
jgi:RNA polymerase sigma factor (sigma-70 family)